MTGLTEIQKRFYQENGYLHVPRVFDAQTILRLSDELDWIYTVPGRITTPPGKDRGVRST